MGTPKCLALPGVRALHPLAEGIPSHESAAPPPFALLTT